MVCVSASGDGRTGKHALTEAACGEEGQRKEALRCCRVVEVELVVVVGGGGYQCSSRNNVSVEQAGDRCFVEEGG